MRRIARSVFGLALAFALSAPAVAQEPQGGNLPSLSPEQTAALDELSSRFATEMALIQGWFRDRTVLYYDFGAVPVGVAVGRVLWPIHGFDMRGNPVAIRGQRPVFSTIPGLAEYSGLWRLVYVVTADKVQPNTLRDVASVDTAIRARRANLRETNLTLNLPIVPRGTTLARDTTQGMLGWYQGREVQFFDFGQASATPAPMWRFILGRDPAGDPIMLEGQNGILDSIPVAPTYPDLWDIRFAKVDSTYERNSIKSAAALRSAAIPVDSATFIRNLPVTIIDGSPFQRVASPVRMFADMRTPFPPKPTPPQ